MPEMRKSTLYTSFWGRTGVIVALAALMLSILLPTVAIAGGPMEYPVPDKGDGEGKGYGWAINWGEDEPYKTIYPREDYHAMGYEAEPDHGPVKMRGMPKAGAMAYPAPAPDKGDGEGKSYGWAINWGEDEPYKTIYPRDDFHDMVEKPKPDHGPVKMGDMPE